MVQLKAKIITHQKIKNNCWHLEFDSGQIAKNSQPGQFINIKISDGFEPLLRRPVSIHGVKGNKIRILYEVVGPGTQILSQRKPGEFLDIIGPLGNGFDYQQAAKAKEKKAILIAGGMGVAPLIFLAEKLKLTKPLVLIGAKSKEQLLCMQEFKTLGCPVKIATDDGSLGFSGKVTDLLKNILEETKPKEIFSCGPRPMLKVISEIANQNKINAQLSLEEHMACGIGACLGCVVATKSGYKSVCKDGPIFFSKDLTW